MKAVNEPSRRQFLAASSALVLAGKVAALDEKSTTPDSRLALRGGPKESPQALQPAIEAALKRVSPSVVRIWDNREPSGSITGTVISPDGLVLTCAHIEAKVNELVKIQLPDGPKVEGKVQVKLAEEKVQDLALLQLSPKGPWPAVEIGRADNLTIDDQLLAIGFPATGVFGLDEQPRLVRLGHPIETIIPPAPHPNLLFTSIRTFAGDSGGPLFDIGGRLIGVAHGADAHGTRAHYTKVDVLRKEWEKLVPGRAPLPSATIACSNVASPSAVTAAGARAVRRSVVEVRSDDRWILFGCVVGKGLVLTKASELGPKLTVLLENDLVARAHVAATDPTRDLALLRLPAADLTEGIPPVRWADVNDLSAGTPVAVATPPEFTPPAGIVCHPALASPGHPGVLPVEVKDADGGVEVVKEQSIKVINPTVSEWMRMPVFPIQPGDVITRVAGEPVVDQKVFWKFFESKKLGRHPRIAGETITVTIRRKGRAIDEAVRLYPSYNITTQLVLPTSYRFTGFPTAIATDVPARPEHCGAPVVDARGQVVGMLVARAMVIESLVLPASEVRTSMESMQKEIAKEK